MSLKGLEQAYRNTVVGKDAWVYPYGTSLDEFQLVVAIAKAWAGIGTIQVLDTLEVDVSGRRLVNAVHFRRLR
jgi:hypothetical protein